MIWYVLGWMYTPPMDRRDWSARASVWVVGTYILGLSSYKVYGPTDTRTEGTNTECAGRWSGYLVI